MFCKNCGTQVEDDSKFCNNCGAEIIKEKKSQYVGEVKKCPNCGEIISSFALKCNACGYELRNVESSNAILSLQQSLDEINKNIEDNGSALEKFSSLMGFRNINRKTSKMIELIKNFSIPNTKEDILEFMVMASSNINIDIFDCPNDNLVQNEKALSEAWISKMDQAYQKSCLTMNNEKEFIQIEYLYKTKMNDIKKAKFAHKIKFILAESFALALLLALLITGIVLLNK